MPIARPDSWTLFAVSTGLVSAPVTKTGVAGKSHYITHISASFEVANVGKRLQLRDEGTVVFQWWVQEDLGYDFSDAPIKISLGGTVILELEASANIGDDGSNNMAGYTAVPG